MTSGPGSRVPQAVEPSAARVESLVRGIQARDGTGHAPERARGGRATADRGRLDRNRDRGPWMGLLGRPEWERLVRDETLRQRRYGHVHAIMLAEIRGLDPDAPPPAVVDVERAMPACGTALLRVSRTSDRIGRLGPTRFGILLRESDAIGASKYAVRAIAACDPWLAASSIPMRLSLGWSAPDGDGDLGRAHYLAERHLTTGRRP